jgi:hypothetical protein
MTVPTLNCRCIVAAVLVAAALGAASGGFTTAMFHDTGDADLNASVVDHFQVEATAVSTSPSEINTSRNSPDVTVTFEVPAPEDVDDTEFAARLDGPDTGSIQAVDANSSCDSSGCTVVFERSDVEALANSTGTYTLVVTGAYDDGGTLRGDDTVEFCDTNCDGTVNAAALTVPHWTGTRPLAVGASTLFTEVTIHGRA